MTDEKEVKEEAESKKTTKKEPNKSLAIILTIIVGIIVIYGISSNSFRAASQRKVDKSAQKAIEKAVNGQATVDISEGGEKIEIETNEATFTAGKQELPANFPTDMPVYPQASIVSTSSNADNIVVIFSSTDPSKTITDFYKRELNSKGWETETLTTMGNASIFGVKIDEFKGGVVISETDERTQIIVELETASE